jgi:hypothetical protein
LRSVKVTRAFDPSPPLRHDCDEIFSPESGAGCAGAIASEVARLNEGSFADVFVTGAMSAATGGGSVASDAARSTGTLSAGLLARPGTSTQAPSPAIMTTGSKARLKYLVCTLPDPPEKWLLAGPVAPARAIPGVANSSNSIRSSPLLMAMPPLAKRTRLYCTAQQKAARALHRTTPDTTADCAVPPFSSIREGGNGCIRRNNIRQQWRSRAVSASRR